MLRSSSVLLASSSSQALCVFFILLPHLVLAVKHLLTSNCCWVFATPGCSFSSYFFGSCSTFSAAIEDMEEANIPKISVKMLKDGISIEVEHRDGKDICPHCHTPAKNLLLHLLSKKSCQNLIDMAHFTDSFNAIKDARLKERKKRNKLNLKLRARQGSGCVFLPFFH